MQMNTLSSIFNFLQILIHLEKIIILIIAIATMCFD